jgi:hypothetical protein
MYFAGIKATPATVGPEIFLPPTVCMLKLHGKITHETTKVRYRRLVFQPHVKIRLFMVYPMLRI